MTRCRARLLCNVMLVVVAVAAYAACLRAGFVYDDFEFVVDNPRVRSLRGLVGAFWRRDFFSASAKFNIYRPFAAVWFALDFRLWELRPSVLHMENVLLHAVNAALVFGLCVQLFGAATPAFVAALLFALHPIQTEAVAWVAGRANGLFVFFALLAVRAHVARRYGLALATFGAALLSKEMAISLPLLLCAYELILRRPNGDRVRWRAVGASFVLAAAYVAWRAFVLGRVTQRGPWGGGFGPTALTMTRVFTDYVRLLLLPVGQTLYHAVDVSTRCNDPRVVVAAGAVVGIVAFGLSCIRRAPIVAFGVFWFFLALIPVSNVVPLRALEAERFLYWPALGAFVAGGCLAGRHRRNVWLALCACMCFAALTIDRAHDWRSGYALWRSTIRVVPRCPSALNGVGNAYSAMGALRRAIRAYRKALRVEPDFEFAQTNLADTLREMGGLDEAEAQYLEALRDHPKSVAALIGLSHIAVKRGQLDAAERWLRGAIAARPDFADAHNNLASVLMLRADTAGARVELEKALALRPDSPEAHYNYALILRAEGREGEARWHFRQSERWRRGRTRP